MLKIPEDIGILFGMSFGYPDKEAVVNTTRTDRAAIEDSVVSYSKTLEKGSDKPIYPPKHFIIVILLNALMHVKHMITQN